MGSIKIKSAGNSVNHPKGTVLLFLDLLFRLGHLGRSATFALFDAGYQIARLIGTGNPQFTIGLIRKCTGSLSRFSFFLLKSVWKLFLFIQPKIGLIKQLLTQIGRNLLLFLEQA